MSNYLSLKSATIEKINPRSNGNIHYRILADAAYRHLFVVFTGNDDSGHFSDEIVPFERIEKCIEGIKPGSHVASKQFFKAFESRSNNNSGFLAAILRAEGLLSPVVDGVRKHVLNPGWDRWKETLLTDLGEPWAPPVKTKPGPPPKKAKAKKAVPHANSQ